MNELQRTRSAIEPTADHQLPTPALTTRPGPERRLRLKTGLRAGLTRRGGDDDPGTIIIIGRDGP